MPWSKLKNIILMILLVTNLCLLVLVGGQELQNSRLKSRAREDTIQLIRGRGVQVEENLIPQSMTLRPQTGLGLGRAYRRRPPRHSGGCRIPGR